MYDFILLNKDPFVLLTIKANVVIFGNYNNSFIDHMYNANVIHDMLLSLEHFCLKVMHFPTNIRSIVAIFKTKKANIK